MKGGTERTRAQRDRGLSTFGDIPARPPAERGRTLYAFVHPSPNPGNQMSAALLCLSTCPDAETAAKIARVLVEERLAACVNRVSGIASTYRWQGKIHEDTEVLMMIKTTCERFDALRDRLTALHPHDLPELVALEIAEGLPAYLDWLARETASP